MGIGLSGGGLGPQGARAGALRLCERGKREAV